MADAVVIMILAVIIGYACFHIYKTRKQGGCPGCSGSCSAACSGSCSAGRKEADKKSRTRS